jgi:hypothetical protein
MNATSEQQAQDRQRLEAQIQELTIHRASLVHQAEVAIGSVFTMVTSSLQRPH